MNTIGHRGETQEILTIRLARLSGRCGSTPLDDPPSHVPPATDAARDFHINDGWLPIVEEELFRFNRYGTEYIASCSEALLKCHGIKRAYDQFGNTMFFRGEHRYGWALLPRFSRNRELTIEDCHKVTPQELDAMRRFQEGVLGDSTKSASIFGDGRRLGTENAGWWHLMQHYDDVDATRMIDVTTSIFCALYFACADWDGSVDESVDGKLYMFPYQPGRGDTPNPERFRKTGPIISGEDETQSTLEDYFTVEGSLEYPRFRTAIYRNDRALAQDGYFVWQPMFTSPLKTMQILPFRVYRDAKREIIAELASIGYTRDRILGNHEWIRQ
ncbi:MAG: FRG domain-containing protein [Rhodocyclaceae bacterium]|nr:FRG domain-containing protein [Rhodocyclaceae bacterium]